MTKALALPESGVFASTEEYLAWVATQKRSKYHAEPLVVDGVRWDSSGEYRRWCDLCFLRDVEEITDLRRQVPYDLHAPSGAVVGRLVLDFVYREGGTLVYEDFKGFETALWKWKRKHFEAEYGPILVTKGRG